MCSHWSERRTCLPEVFTSMHATHVRRRKGFVMLMWISGWVCRSRSRSPARRSRRRRSRTRSSSERSGSPAAGRRHRARPAHRPRAGSSHLGRYSPISTHPCASALFGSLGYPAQGCLFDQHAQHLSHASTCKSMCKNFKKTNLPLGE